MTPRVPEPFPRIRFGGVSRTRRVTDAVVLGGCRVAAWLTLVPLGLVLWHLVDKGRHALTVGFFVHNPKPVGEPGGGMANAIVGTFVLLGIAAAIAVPVGVAAGVYLAEYGRNRFATTVRYVADVLSGVPSIVVGVVAYGLVVIPMGRFSAFAGGVSLAILMLPTIVRSTEEMVLLVPRSYREGALALGAPEWRVTQQVVLPAAAAGITTSCMLALARAAGETAPLLFTALGNRFWSVALDRPIGSLPVLIFDYARSPYEDWNRQAWTGALVLLILIALMSAALRYTTRRIR
jgi:phosphate transport system permease protein